MKSTQLGQFDVIDDWLKEGDWIAQSSQDRSKGTINKVLVTARDLFFEKGYDNTSVAQIAKAASVSVGAIYHHFSDKAQILYALHRAYRDARIELLSDLLAKAKATAKAPEDVLALHMDIIFGSARSDRRFLRLVEELRIKDPRIHELQTRWDDEFCQQMLALYRAVSTQPASRQLAKQVRCIHNVFRASAMWSVLHEFTPNDFMRIDNKTYAQEAYTMCAAYLGLKTTRKRTRR
jgi:AcrR family transcriptional regulator